MTTARCARRRRPLLLARLATLLGLGLALVVCLAPWARADAPEGPETAYNDAGYVSVDEGRRHLFYWLFESRHEPTRDPLILWMSGGPGCSSLLALFSENGPYRIEPRTGALRLHPASWTSNATVVFLDQPAGTGFSWGVPVHNEQQVARDVYSFLQKLLRRYPRYRGRPLYIFGESYAGHYVPAVSREIVERQAARPPQEEVDLSFAGCAIGNGLTDPSIQYRYFAPYAEEKGLVSDAQLALMRGLLPLCEGLSVLCNRFPFNESKWDEATARALDWTACLNAYVFCNLGEMLPIQSTGVNPYDVRLKCDPAHKLCYDFDHIDAYLNRPEVQAALGVPRTRSWQQCNPIVDLFMVYGGDWMRTYDGDVAAVLEAGFPVLVYVGTEDAMCNYMGNRAWTERFAWSGHRAFQRAELVDWALPVLDNARFPVFGLNSNTSTITTTAPRHLRPAGAGSGAHRQQLQLRQQGTVRGRYKSARGLTYLMLYEAGHLVPMDQPEVALEMVRQFTLGAHGGFRPTTAMG